jgi:hypothetical protein
MVEPSRVAALMIRPHGPWRQPETRIGALKVLTEDIYWTVASFETRRRR